MTLILQNTTQAHALLRLLAGPSGTRQTPSGQTPATDTAIDLGAAPAQNRPSVKAGFLKGSAYPDGTPMALVAAVQEYGATIRKTTHARAIVRSVIPPRPFLRNAVTQDAQKWQRIFKTTLQKSLASSGNPTTMAQTLRNPTPALHTTGQAMQASITQSLQALHAPPNAASTIAHKKSDKPLEDTKALLHAIAFQVEA
ncbi:hypothetical protein LHT11_05835 [Acetobacter indonesiensis]|uniref:hypothetical protein n=1 Tax=Acetobacter indonesiensis TaxID=104101 RepID=UPI001F363A01|nr:hypothetical protein [Acetobacter indonesiensis]MCG0994722.1 hypothetical protein [Acetobacter indonesiensis]